MRNDDSDMKIAGEFGEPIQTVTTDDVVDEFVVQKTNGNIEKARALGLVYAQRLIACTTAANSQKQLDEPAVITEQRKVLFSYAVSYVVNEFSPNSTLSHTTLAVFYDEIKKYEELYAQINNLGAISLYMLTGRKNRPTAGHVFSSLCGDKTNQKYIELGNHLFHYYVKSCKHELKKIGYV